MPDTRKHPKVDTARCTGCGRCVAACRERLFTLEVCGYRKHAVLQAPERCSLCLQCVEACRVGALACDGEEPPPSKPQR